MTVKQKETYSVSYDSSNDVLSEKLNVLLSNIINLIRSHNPSLLELTRIEYNSEEMTDAPLYNGNTNLTESSRRFESDVVFLGTSKNNLVLSVCFYGGRLVISMNVDPSIESAYMDNWNNIKYTSDSLNVFAVAKACRYITNSGTAYNRYNINTAYNVLNNTISIDVVYWYGLNSSGYKFGTNILTIFKTVEDEQNTQSLGCAITKANNCLLVFSFNEQISIITDQRLNATALSSIFCNSKTDLREWFGYYTSNGFYVNRFECKGMAYLHTLGGLNGCDNSNASNQMGSFESINTKNNVVSPLLTPYNLPFIGEEQGYFRKVHIPGFNNRCIGEIYLMWTPSETAFAIGDIVSCDNKNFVILGTGIVTWAVRI